MNTTAVCSGVCDHLCLVVDITSSGGRPKCYCSSGYHYTGTLCLRNPTDVDYLLAENHRFRSAVTTRPDDSGVEVHPTRHRVGRALAFDPYREVLYYADDDMGNSEAGGGGGGGVVSRVSMVTGERDTYSGVERVKAAAVDWVGGNLIYATDSYVGLIKVTQKKLAPLPDIHLLSDFTCI